MLNSGKKLVIFLSRVTLKIDGWLWKTIENLSYAASSFVHHFIAIGEFKLELQSGNTQFGSKLTIFLPCDLEIWRMTLKNNRAPLLSNIKLCASFHCHMWIQTGVTVWKRLNGVMTSVTLTFDLWPWPFARTSRLSMVITPENFRIIRWQQHCEKGGTDGWTEISVLRTVWSQLKMLYFDNQSTLIHVMVWCWACWAGKVFSWINSWMHKCHNAPMS